MILTKVKVRKIDEGDDNRLDEMDKTAESLLWLLPS